MTNKCNLPVDTHRNRNAMLYARLIDMAMWWCRTGVQIRLLPGRRDPCVFEYANMTSRPHSRAHARSNTITTASKRVAIVRRRHLKHGSTRSCTGNERRGRPELLLEPGSTRPLAERKQSEINTQGNTKKGAGLNITKQAEPAIERFRIRIFFTIQSDGSEHPKDRWRKSMADQGYRSSRTRK